VQCFVLFFKLWFSFYLLSVFKQINSVFQEWYDPGMLPGKDIGLRTNPNQNKKPTPLPHIWWPEKLISAGLEWSLKAGMPADICHPRTMQGMCLTLNVC
jgi:hypothetical protein